MQPQQLDQLVHKSQAVAQLAREAARVEVEAMLLSTRFRDTLREIIRDEATENRPNESRASMAFEIRFLRREIEALTKQLATINAGEVLE
jgi:hypothetical protein